MDNKIKWDIQARQGVAGHGGGHPTLLHFWVFQAPTLIISYIQRSMNAERNKLNALTRCSNVTLYTRLSHTLLWKKVLVYICHGGTCACAFKGKVHVIPFAKTNSF